MDKQFLIHMEREPLIKCRDLNKMSLNLNVFNKIDKTISAKDIMFQGNRDHYFFVGYSAVKCINLALEVSETDSTNIKTILDLPSGYGRVLRWIIAAFPNSEIFACDLDTDGVDFCAKQFGANPVYSNANPEKIKIEQMFDLIWCGSLFTHLNCDQWIKNLKLYNSLLNTDGILIFTTHGPYVAYRGQNGAEYGMDIERFKRIVNNFNTSGFGYENYESNDTYGISISKPSFTFKILEDFTELRIVLYKEKAWDYHQDLVVCYKDSHYKDMYFTWDRTYY